MNEIQLSAIRLLLIRRHSRNLLSDHQGVYVIGPLIGLDGFEVAEVTHDGVFVRNPVGAQQIAAQARAFQGDGGVVALEHGNLSISAIYLESGASMYYFTGKRAPGQAWILPVKGEAVWTPAEAAKAAQALRDVGIATGAVGLEEQVRFATRSE